MALALVPEAIAFAFVAGVAPLMSLQHNFIALWRLYLLGDLE